MIPAGLREEPVVQLTILPIRIHLKVHQHGGKLLISSLKALGCLQPAISAGGGTFEDYFILCSVPCVLGVLSGARSRRNELPHIEVLVILGG